MLCLTIAPPAELRHYVCDLHEFPATDAAALRRRRPDTCVVVLDHADAVVARAALWWNATPISPRGRIGLIGHYAAQTPAAAAHLLNLACAKLAAHGCTLAVGPVNGSVWECQPCVMDGCATPARSGEPAPSTTARQFAANGFAAFTQYESTLIADLARPNPRIDVLAERVAAAGVRVRALQLDAWDDELRLLYTIAARSSRNDPLFSPHHEAAFRARLEALRPHLEPELCVIAEYAGRGVGFAIAVPEPAHALGTEPLKTITLHTIAVLPELNGLALGSVLAARCHHHALAQGYRRAVHAMMPPAAARSVAMFGAQPFRRYAVLARPLHG